MGWSTRILDVVLDSVSESIHHEIYYLLRGMESQKRYFRRQLQLEESERRLDNATQVNIENLTRVAKKFVAANRDRIDEICCALS